VFVKKVVNENQTLLALLYVIIVKKTKTQYHAKIVVSHLEKELPRENFVLQNVRVNISVNMF